MELLLQQLSLNLPLIASGLTVLLLFALMILFFLLLRLKESREEAVLLVKHQREDRSAISSLHKEHTEYQVRIAKLVTLLKNERRHTGEKLAILEDAKEKLGLQFQALAQKIFEEKSEKFGHENKERVSAVLQPLENQLLLFQKRIDDIQVNDVRERMSLKKEIIHLRELNLQINKEATNLTRALRGDKKVQGNWGELVLERVLEKSGLRKGHEYSTQGGFRDRENRLLKPDVIVHLPDDKDIIIDSKVSLVAWEKYINCEVEEEKKGYLKEHIRAIRNHINGLSSKDYSAIPGLHSLDFVLLFIPIDSSFIAAFEADELLFTDSLEQRIVVVTPTTLLATLKTVENVWRYERQNQNAAEIAERAGAIYDKLRGYLEDMEKIGKQLSTCSVTYESAMTKLSKGRGNIISQAGRLTQLGVQVKKEIPRSITAVSDTNLPN